MKMMLTNIVKIGAPSNILPRRGLSCAQRDCASNAKGRGTLREIVPREKEYNEIYEEDAECEHAKREYEENW
jgi:hypothetical protein